jgi:hypothetical protein
MATTTTMTDAQVNSMPDTSNRTPLLGACLLEFSQHVATAEIAVTET